MKQQQLTQQKRTGAEKETAALKAKLAEQEKKLEAEKKELAINKAELAEKGKKLTDFWFRITTLSTFLWRTSRLCPWPYHFQHVHHTSQHSHLIPVIKSPPLC